LTADKTWLGDAGAQTVVTTNGDNQLVIGTNNNFTDHTLTFNIGGNIGIKTKATGSFDVTASNKAYFLVDASNQIITNFVTDQSTYRTEVWQTKDYHKISAQNNAGTTIYTSVEVNRTGLKLNSLTWPSADGTTDQVLKTDGSGNLSWVSVITASSSLFSAYAVTGSTLTGTGTWGLITLDGEEYDTAGHFDSTTFSRFKPTVAGYYQLSGIVGPGTATVNQIGIWKNGTAYKYGDARNISCVVYLNGSTDYVQLYASGPSTGVTGTSLGAGSRLEGFFLRS
jgi:hypothetical protein